jgi:uncharacterized protein YqgV (UPF0045/DUF77 family)
LEYKVSRGCDVRKRSETHHACFDFQLGGFGTSIEGEFQTVCKVIEDCHKTIHSMGVGRIVVSRLA